jgi:hypothetical protein
MKERPILFNGDMVRAILEGRKTQTRRLISGRLLQHGYDTAFNRTTSLRGCPLTPFQDVEGPPGKMLSMSKESIQAVINSTCPHGQPGDRLWVRETWRLFDSSSECACYDECKCSSSNGKPIYRASLPDDEGPWKPSIHMPRWASRITLEITGIRVERLNEITRGEAMQEGCPTPNMAGQTDPRAWFSDLWESINGAGSWGVNPWVWVIEFRKVEEGQMSAEKCPHCGAEKRPVCKDIHHYECGSNRFCNYRSPYCREREAHNKTRKSLDQIHSEWKEKCLEAETLRQHLKIAQSLLPK